MQLVLCGLEMDVFGVDAVQVTTGFWSGTDITTKMQTVRRSHCPLVEGQALTPECNLLGDLCPEFWKLPPPSRCSPPGEQRAGETSQTLGHEGVLRAGRRQ